MGGFQELLQQGASNAWLFIPSAILLGALHGLEPGHSKTMMAAFIVAIRGTVGQAVLLGLSATASHTAVVWAVALLGLHFGSKWSAETNEPYFQVASAVLILGVALWMLLRTYREGQQEKEESAHSHHDESHRIDTGHGVITLSVFEDGVPPRFRIYFERAAKSFAADAVTLVTTRPDTSVQRFTFSDRGAFLESVDEIPEPHEFSASLLLGHGTHTHDYDVTFSEGQSHAHGLDVSAPGFQDAHERAHANDIRNRFATRQVTTGQIVVFGLTGGLIPCPAAITVLLLCLQLKQFTLGVALVLCFSIGLAVTMVAAGTVAALSVRHIGSRWSGFGTFARRAPYFSSALILLMGLYVGWDGLTHLPQ